MQKPTWNKYFLNILEVVKSRSPDPRTHVACIFTKNHRILGTGYNGQPSGLDLAVTNENKYPWMVHAEENCVANSTHKPDMTAYITHLPCHRCMRLMWQCGVRRIITPKNRKVFTYTDDDWTVLGGHIWLGLKLHVGDDLFVAKGFSLQPEESIELFQKIGQELKECLMPTK